MLRLPADSFPSPSTARGDKEVTWSGRARAARRLATLAFFFLLKRTVAAMRNAAIACTPPPRSVRTRASMPAARACRRAPTISSPPTRPHPASWRFHRGMFRMNLREPPQRCACADADDGSFAIGCARQPSRAHVRLPRQLKRTSCASLLAVRAALFEGARLRIARLLGCAPARAAGRGYVCMRDNHRARPARSAVSGRRNSTAPPGAHASAGARN